MNLYQLLSALRARVGLFAFLLLVTVLFATAASLLMPKVYTATALLLLDAAEQQSLNNAMRPMMLPQERAAYLQTQLDIITSEKVAQKVVADLKLAQRRLPEKPARNEVEQALPVEARLAEELLQDLKVETSQSSVIKITYSSQDARHAADVANAFGKAYVDTMLELRVEPAQKAAAWFDEQLKALRANLEEAQAQLTRYHQVHGIVAADERMDVESTRLADLSEQVVRAQEQSFQWAEREAALRDSIAGKGSPENLAEVLENPFIQRLKEELLKGEAKLRELGANYGPNYPPYQRQLEHNRSLKQKLDAEMDKLVEAISSAARQSRLREARSRKALAEQSAKVLRMKEGRNELTVLRRNVESAERAYDTAMQRSVVSRVESQANQTNVMVLNPAAVPRQPSSPKVVLNIALSVVVGTILGIVAVMLLEMLDRRVRSRSDLEHEVPVLAVLDETLPVGRRLGISGPAKRSLLTPG